MPSSADWPVPKRSLNVRSATASLTAMTGHARRPSASSARSRTSPVLVSSVPPSMPSSRSGRARWSAVSRSAPSSSVIRGARATTAATRDAHASASSPRTAWTSMPPALSAAATSSWVANGFEAQSATSAPPAASVRASIAVSDVTCRHAPTISPSRGRSLAKRSRIERSTGIWSSAHRIRASPASISGRRRRPAPRPGDRCRPRSSTSSTRRRAPPPDRARRFRRAMPRRHAARRRPPHG